MVWLGQDVGFSVTEAFAEWLGARALKAAGYAPQAAAKLEGHIRDFREVGPAGENLDIVNETSDIQQSKACQGKWIWILAQLEDKYGSQFMRHCLQSLRTDPDLLAPENPEEAAKKKRITIDDIVYHMSIAAGEDLFPWFKEMGITVHPRAIPTAAKR